MYLTEIWTAKNICTARSIYCYRALDVLHVVRIYITLFNRVGHGT